MNLELLYILHLQGSDNIIFAFFAIFKKVEKNINYFTLILHGTKLQMTRLTLGGKKNCTSLNFLNILQFEHLKKKDHLKTLKQNKLTILKHFLKEQLLFTTIN